MNKKTSGDYIAPEIDVIMIQTEQGFATSGDTEGFGGQEGGWGN
jgi:hypothetical protein